jgi:hypothetical protein
VDRIVGKHHATIVRAVWHARLEQRMDIAVRGAHSAFHASRDLADRHGVLPRTFHIYRSLSAEERNILIYHPENSVLKTEFSG